jgi:hypothetical protein
MAAVCKTWTANWIALVAGELARRGPQGSCARWRLSPWARDDYDGARGFRKSRIPSGGCDAVHAVRRTQGGQVARLMHASRLYFRRPLFRVCGVRGRGFSRIEKTFPKNWKKTPRCGHYIHEGQRLISGRGTNDRGRRLFSTASTPTQAAALSPTAPLLLFSAHRTPGQSGTPRRPGFPVCNHGKLPKTNDKSQRNLKHQQRKLQRAFGTFPVVPWSFLGICYLSFGI